MNRNWPPTASRVTNTSSVGLPCGRCVLPAQQGARRVRRPRGLAARLLILAPCSQGIRASRSPPARPSFDRRSPVEDQSRPPASRCSSQPAGGRPIPAARESMQLTACRIGPRQLLGVVAFRLGSRQLTVDGLAVAPDWRRCGMCSLLLRLVGRIARRANVSEIAVDAVAHRAPFYSRASFGPAPWVEEIQRKSRVSSPRMDPAERLTDPGRRG